MNKKLIKIVITFVAIFIIVGFFIFNSKPKVDHQELIDSESSLETEDTQINLGKVENGKYTNDAYGFSLTLPAGMTATNFNEGEGTTILVSNGTFQMQIFVSQFDEDISLTIARIKKDVPDIKMIEPIEIKTGGVATVAFYSNDNGEKNREIWFVRGGYLYQVLAKASDDNTTGTVMEGWKWKE